MKTAVLLGLLAFAAIGAETKPVPNFQLVNQEGKPFQLHDLKGKYVLLSFVFTRCPLPKMCPLTMTLTKKALKDWNARKGAPPLHALVATLDPQFDSAAVLRKYGQSHGVDFSSFTLATGAPQALSDFAAEFNVMGMPSQGSIAHNLKTILLGPDMVEIKQYKDNEFQPADIVRDMEAATKAKSSR